MHTLLLRLVGPMQSWGTISRFDERDTGREPSKSGVLGLLAAALGIDRNNWADLKPLTSLSLAVRHDRPGKLKKDFQTAGCARVDTIIRASGGQSRDGVISQRHYLADAAFLVALGHADRSLLDSAHEALGNPTWPLFLGRRSYVPSEPVQVQDAVQQGEPLDVLKSWPWIATLRHGEEPPEKLLVSFDSKDATGVLKMDQPLGCFADRRFGERVVQTNWISFPKEECQ